MTVPRNTQCPFYFYKTKTVCDIKGRLIIGLTAKKTNAHKKNFVGLFLFPHDVRLTKRPDTRLVKKTRHPSPRERPRLSFKNTVHVNQKHKNRTPWSCIPRRQNNKTPIEAFPDFVFSALRAVYEAIDCSLAPWHRSFAPPNLSREEKHGEQKAIDRPTAS